MIVAAVALIGGFAFLNQGLYETIGKHWYAIADERSQPIYADFLAYALTKILGLIDVLDLARSHHILGSAFVRPAAWPASALLAGFKVFFTFVLLHQIFASLRQGKLLAETIADFWSPHEPIHERACGALPIYGTVAIGPLLGSLRLVPSLTKEQRTEIPLILETIGPSIIPALVGHLHDPHEHVRAIAAAALGHLHALETVPVLAELANDPSDVVRQSVVAALGSLGCPSTAAPRAHTGALAGGVASWAERSGGLSGGRRRPALAPPTKAPIELAIADAGVCNLADPLFGRAGPGGHGSGQNRSGTRRRLHRDLIDLIQEGDEVVRRPEAEALGEIGGVGMGPRWPALVDVLRDASVDGQGCRRRRALAGALRKAAAPSVPAAWSRLLAGPGMSRCAQPRPRAISPGRNARSGRDRRSVPWAGRARDNVVRAQAAEALGTISCCR